MTSHESSQSTRKRVLDRAPRHKTGGAGGRAIRLHAIPVLAMLAIAAPAVAQTLVSSGLASFGQTVGDVRAIESVSISSTPSIDADGDGTRDTYGAGDRIVVDVIFNGLIVVTRDDSLPRRDMGVRLRLDLGADDADLGNSRRVLVNPVVVNHNTLRFRYRVKPRDIDEDGVWIQTSEIRDQVVFLLGRATLTDGNGKAAVRTKSDMPTVGDPGHKVDGGRRYCRARRWRGRR